VKEILALLPPRAAAWITALCALAASVLTALMAASAFTPGTGAYRACSWTLLVLSVLGFAGAKRSEQAAAEAPSKSQQVELESMQAENAVLRARLALASDRPAEAPASGPLSPHEPPPPPSAIQR
jgi:hypothetical protein